MFTDKFQLLSEDAAARLHSFNLNIKPVDLVAEWNKFHEAILAKANPVEQEEKASMKPQLALPSREILSDPGAETSFKAENKDG